MTSQYRAIRRSNDWKVTSGRLELIQNSFVEGPDRSRDFISRAIHDIRILYVFSQTTQTISSWLCLRLFNFRAVD